MTTDSRTGTWCSTPRPPAILPQALRWERAHRHTPARAPLAVRARPPARLPGRRGVAGRALARPGVPRAGRRGQPGADGRRADRVDASEARPRGDPAAAR